MCTLPEDGLSRAPIIFNSMGFPLPEGPTTDTNSPLFTVKLTFLRDTALPIEDAYTLERFSTFKITSVLSIFLRDTALPIEDAYTLERFSTFKITSVCQHYPDESYFRHKCFHV